VLASFFVLICGILTLFPLFSERGLYIHLVLTEDARSYWLLSLLLLIWPAWRNLIGGAVWFVLPLTASVLLSLPLIQSGMLHKKNGCTQSFQFTNWLTRTKVNSAFKTLNAANDEALALVYKSRSPNSPVVFLLHGGGFYQGKPIYMHEWCSALASSGITAVSLAYPLEPYALFPAPEDSVAARIARMKPLLATENVDTNRIFIGGSSAGGTLAISTALRHSHLKIKGIIALYPLVSLCTDFETILNVERVKKAYLGKLPCSEVDVLRRLHANVPPLLLMHGSKDNVVPATQSDSLYTLYRGKKRLVRLPWAGHNFEYPIYGPSGQLTTHLSVDFVLKGI